ncbi:putative regulatory factor Sgt1 [Phyllosticta citrichinensis]
MAEDKSKDGLKWFGEGFDGFPKKPPDDTVEYIVFIIDPKVSTDNQIRERLRDIENAADSLSKNLLKDYIWQRESFGLQLQREDGSWLLRGTTNYGDSVADEWLIVYLLRELSNQFPDAWIRVFDTDGEFLLIEAANVLPKWLNPEVAENRVWINDSKLCVIPVENSDKRPLTIQESRKFIQTTPSKLVHSALVEEEAFYRLRNYPKEISSTLHHSLVTIPRKLAFLLCRNPAYISPAVEAFYLRDPISLRPLKDGSGLKFPPQDLVTVRVRFTKVGFAQLKSQQFVAPQVWEAEIVDLKPGKRRDRLEMGMKLGAGFDMLMADPQNQDKRTVREIELLLEDVEAGEEHLPTDDEIAKWDAQEDDEGWMDINYEEFEKELQGKTSKGFGDKGAQANLQKMVQRFESFLNDKEAGAEGAELEDMDIDDDEDISSDDEEEDKAASFDEEEFSKMMREMMGMPEEVYKEVMEMPLDEVKAAKENRGKLEEISTRINQQEEEKMRPFFGPERPPVPEETENKDTAEDDDAWGEQEAKEFRENMEAMEAELRQAGALDLDPKTKEAIQSKGKGKGKAREVEEDVEEIPREDGEVDIDYNLAKNMLEAFKAQGGMAGPAGNMMRSMGLNMPRDEPDD